MVAASVGHDVCSRWKIWEYLLVVGAIVVFAPNSAFAFTTTTTNLLTTTTSRSTPQQHNRGLRLVPAQQLQHQPRSRIASVQQQQQRRQQQRSYPLSIRWLSFKPHPPRHPPDFALFDQAQEQSPTLLIDSEINNGKSDANKFRVNEDDDDDEDVLSFFEDEPVEPPNGPRPDPQKLSESVKEQRQMYEEAEERVSLMQVLVEDYQEQLEAKERMLQNERDSWSMEKIGLLAQIAEWTKAVQSFQQDQSQVADSLTDQKIRQDQLQQEITELKAQLNEAQVVLQSEREAAQQVKSCLLQAEDQLEFEQMRFKKEKDLLLQQVNSSKTRLDEVERTLQQAQQKMDQERQTYQQQLRDETSRLQSTQTQLEQIQKEFDAERVAMESQMKEQRLRYLEAQDTLGQEQTRFEEERVSMENMVQTEKTKLRQLEQRWKKDQASFQATQQDLEMKIVYEKKRVQELSDKLNEEMERFNKERTQLEDRLEEERTRLLEVQAQLAEEQLLYQEQKAELEYKLSEEIRIGLLKKRQMNNRFESIRKELTALWQGAKREARVEKERLTKKYEEQLEAMAINVQSLEEDLSHAVQSSDSLRAEIQGLQTSKARLQQEYDNMEMRYRTTLTQRNVEISNLQVTVSNLRSTLLEREEALERYETSFREIAKLGWNLGKARAKATAKRVRNWAVTSTPLRRRF